MINNFELMQMQVISFLHRMIEILGISVLPCIPVALRQLLVDNEVFHFNYIRLK
jgi:exportin-T